MEVKRVLDLVNQPFSKSYLIDKTKAIITDRKNSNDLLNVIAYSESDNKEVIVPCIQAFHKIFVHFLKQNEMYLECTLDPDCDFSDLSAVQRYKLWLRKRYNEVKTRLLHYLGNKAYIIQELALTTLMKFVSYEGNNPLEDVIKHSLFPEDFFESIVYSLLSEDQNQILIIKRFEEFLQYEDIHNNTLKSMVSRLKKFSLVSPSDIFLKNYFNLLKIVQSSAQKSQNSDDEKWLIRLPNSTKTAYRKMVNDLFCQAWLDYLVFRLPNSLYKEVLLILPEQVIPFFNKPLLLSDFLIESYELGGVISLLALNGIFILVHNYNLDYPDFYTKLYALIDPTVCYVKYGQRFFYFLDLFLTSTHIPEYLVAAFIKKLCRVALMAPPNSLMFLIPLICNLLIRHPNLKKMVHNVNGRGDLTSDPYNFEEPDPALCNATESSLWEIKTLQQHYYPGVASASKVIEQNLPSEEKDIADLFKKTTSELFEKESRRGFKPAVLAFEPPTGLFKHKSDTMNLLWTWN